LLFEFDDLKQMKFSIENAAFKTYFKYNIFNSDVRQLSQND